MTFTDDMIYRVSGAVGFDTGKGEKLSNSQADCLVGVPWVLLFFSPFPESNPAGPPDQGVADMPKHSG